MRVDEVVVVVVQPHFPGHEAATPRSLQLNPVQNGLRSFRPRE